MPPQFKRIPYLTRAELRSVLERAEPTSDGCLIIRPTSDSLDPNRVVIRHESYYATRLVWAELRGASGLDDHEVIHIAECLHTGGDRGHYTPICINVDHLMLGDVRLKIRHQLERQSVYRRTP